MNALTCPIKKKKKKKHNASRAEQQLYAYYCQEYSNNICAWHTGATDQSSEH